MAYNGPGSPRNPRPGYPGQPPGPGYPGRPPGPGYPGQPPAPPKPQYSNAREEISASNALFNNILTLLCYFLIIIFPISICCCLQIVQEYERAVIFRWGRLRSGNARGPGIFLVLPLADQYRRVDMRTVTFDIPPQEILTKDSVTVRVDAVLYYRIQDPILSITKVNNVKQSTGLLAQTTLRNVLGTRSLSELLSDRVAIMRSLEVILDEATDPWWVKVERVEITDVKLPIQLQRSMAAEAEAGREARAKIIAAEGEMKAARSLKEAAKVLLESPGSLQLRYLQTLTTIGTDHPTTILFPLPMELTTPFQGKR